MDAPPCSQAEARRDSIVGWTLLGGLVLSIGVMGLGLVLEAVDGSQGGDHVLPLDQILPSLAQGKPPAVVDLGIVLLFAVSVAALVNIGSSAPWSPDLGNLSLPASVTTGLSPTAMQGAQSFEQRGCINCHSLAGVGGQKGPDLTHIGSQLSPDELTWRILNGGRNMPAYGTTLSPAETAALVEFLSTRK